MQYGHIELAIRCIRVVVQQHLISTAIETHLYQDLIQLWFNSKLFEERKCTYNYWNNLQNIQTPVIIRTFPDLPKFTCSRTWHTVKDRYSQLSNPTRSHSKGQFRKGYQPWLLPIIIAKILSCWHFWLVYWERKMKWVFMVLLQVLRFWRVDA